MSSVIKLLKHPNGKFSSPTSRSWYPTMIRRAGGLHYYDGYENNQHPSSAKCAVLEHYFSLVRQHKKAVSAQKKAMVYVTCSHLANNLRTNSIYPPFAFQKEVFNNIEIQYTVIFIMDKDFYKEANTNTIVLHAKFYTPKLVVWTGKQLC